MLTWLALFLLGIKQAFLFGVIAGLLEIVPIIGPMSGGVLPTVVALAMSPVLALWVVGAFIVIQQIENHVLIPMVMSRQVRLHPVTVIFWVFVMGGLYGLIGVFLATPAGVTAGVLYEEFYLHELSDGCEETPVQKSEEDEAATEAVEREQDEKGRAERKNEPETPA